MSWKDSFYEAVKSHLDLPEDAKVYSVEEENTISGYCETCYSESIEVAIYYSRANGDNECKYVYTSLTEFINTL